MVTGNDREDRRISVRIRAEQFECMLDMQTDEFAFDCIQWPFFHQDLMVHLQLADVLHQAGKAQLPHPVFVHPD